MALPGSGRPGSSNLSICSHAPAAYRVLVEGIRNTSLKPECYRDTDLPCSGDGAGCGADCRRNYGHVHYMRDAGMLGFLEEICSIRWDVMEFGAFELIPADAHSVRCNHVYVDCKMPFLIAAESLELDGIETFGVGLVHEPDRIRRFLEGPYPPHNKPRTAGLSDLVGMDCEPCLLSRKSFRAFSETGELCHLTSELVHAVTFEMCSITITISADEEAPMGLRVSW